MTPATLAGFWWDAWQTAVAAQTTIALRLWAYASPGEWESARGRAELTRMVSEKQQAALDAGYAMQRALLLGRGAELLPAFHAGLRPYKRRTTSNAKRLGRRH